MEKLTLYELNLLVRQAIERSLPDDYWVEAELAEIREVGGNCYMEFIQKGLDGNTPVAKASAKCWRSTWRQLKTSFENVTERTLSAGMKILVKAYPQFHELYGYSLIVTDIDPVFTLGDMERKRREIIRVLIEEGVIDLNKELPLSAFAQNIAVISAKNAAGYGDFCNQLEHNLYGFKFNVVLFEAVMQGEKIESSIIDALNRIYARKDSFDCVVIIRGGGATSDLSGFDSLLLAENVANFPLPVITGIGHERDQTVLDMIAHTRVKTPTAAAALLIDNLKTVSDYITEMQDRIIRSVTMRMEREKLRVGRLSEKLNAASKATLFAHVVALDNIALRLNSAKKSLIQRLQSYLSQLDIMERRIENLNPSLMLKRGFSITFHNGKIVRDIDMLHKGDEIETRLYRGTVKSKVN